MKNTNYLQVSYTKRPKTPTWNKVRIRIRIISGFTSPLETESKHNFRVFKKHRELSFIFLLKNIKNKTQ
jgi:hypothetical protein